MFDLISRSALIAEYERIQGAMSDPVFRSILDMLIGHVQRQPAVGAVPVVRCMDCKHFVSPQGVPCCDKFYGLGFPKANGSDFCSYGERGG